ncbi:jg24549 [Pararge aegeria aegeria]|uniref:Jg24549 protein n=1 Tax=Pararge aegeria aegeria TaxID=348720 RepID=A0A8S4SP11_9NEOP|nr:jg24549 [Pararge aegeria aegeria]
MSNSQSQEPISSSMTAVLLASFRICGMTYTSRALQCSLGWNMLAKMPIHSFYRWGKTKGIGRAFQDFVQDVLETRKLSSKANASYVSMLGFSIRNSQYQPEVRKF